MNRFFSPSFLSRWFARSKASATVSRSAFRRVRLTLEVLEDRSLPSILVTVTSASNDPNDTSSLAYALNNATPGEIIDFAPDVRNINLGNITIGVNLTITNDQGVGPVTIDGGVSYTGFTVFTVPEGVTASLSGLTITDGNTTGSNGGGISNAGTLTVNNCTVSNNISGNGNPGAGGGIENTGTLTVSNSTVSGNSASNGGGGIDNYGTLTVSNCTISNNSAEGNTPGGGISNNGALRISDSTFSNNSAGQGGGGIVNNGVGQVAVSDSTFSHNSVRNGEGGAIYNSSSLGTLTVSNTTFSNNSANDGGGIENAGTVTVSDSTFSKNSAGGDGGGIYNLDTLTVSNSTFSGNSAGTQGGGINNGGTLTVGNSTFSNNSAHGYGGGIVNSSNGQVAVSDSTFSANSVTSPSSPPGGGGIYAGTAVSLNGDIVSGNVGIFAGTTTPDDVGGFVGLSSSDNLIGTGGSGGLIDGENGNQVGVSVANVGLGALGDNGGPTQTFAIGPGSFAIGSGITETTATTDQRGVARPINQPSDVGAYQYSATPTVTTDPTNQTIIAGQNTSFSAVAYEGAPTPTSVQWQISTDEGNSFTNLSDDTVYSGVASTTLTITGAPVTLSGDQYRAVFSNAAG